VPTNLSISGNNALAYKTTTTATSSSTSENLDFIYVQDASLAPTAQVNVDAARVNAFYVVNTIHDMTYRYITLEFINLHIDTSLVDTDSQRYHELPFQIHCC